MKTSPLVGLRRPLIMEMVVVLPAPFGPSKLRISPLLMSNDTSLTAVTPLGGSYCLHSFLTSIMPVIGASLQLEVFPSLSPMDLRRTSAFWRLKVLEHPQFLLKNRMLVHHDRAFPVSTGWIDLLVWP